MCSDNEQAVPRIHLRAVQRDPKRAASLSKLDDAPLGVVLASPSPINPRRRPEAPLIKDACDSARSIEPDHVGPREYRSFQTSVQED
jgi:hypothetical protein